MTLTLKATLSAIALTGLMACGGTTVENTGGTTPPPPPPPPAPTGLAPTVTTADVTAQRQFISRGFGLDQTGGFDGVPNGTVSYRGQWTSGLTTSTSPDANGLIGDMNMTIDIGGATNDLSGTVSDINVTNGGVPTEQLRGALRISGTMGGFDNEIRNGSRFSGGLAGYMGGDEERTFSVRADLTGRLRDTVSGRANDGRIVTGRTTGIATFIDGRGGAIDITGGAFRGDSNR